MSPHLIRLHPHPPLSFFFFTATATTEIYTLSLHDALPISVDEVAFDQPFKTGSLIDQDGHYSLDRKSTRLNSSHQIISYAVFCLKKNRDWPLLSRSGLYSTALHVLLLVLLVSYAVGDDF